VNIGEKVPGKWTGQVFRIEKSLGVGANGQVLLVKTPSGRAAMKVCAKSGDVALEWGLLEQLAVNSQVFPRPMLIDDHATQANCYFYIMEWIDGQPLDEVIKRATHFEICLVLEGLLRALSQLHGTRHAFCDIKPQNILVSLQPFQVRFVDVGGVTPFGRSVRQFTPFYDRAFWGLGSRLAEAHYDLCGVALGMICSLCQVPQDIQTMSIAARNSWLQKSLRRFPVTELVPLLDKLLQNKFSGAKEALQECTRLNQSHRQGNTHRVQRGTSNQAKPNKSPKGPKFTTFHHGPTAVKVRDWTEWLMWIALAVAATVTFVAWATVLGWVS